MRSTGQLVPNTTRSTPKASMRRARKGEWSATVHADRTCRGPKFSSSHWRPSPSRPSPRATARNDCGPLAIGIAQWSTQMAVPERRGRDRADPAPARRACRCRRRGCAAPSSAKPRRHAAIDEIAAFAEIADAATRWRISDAGRAPRPRPAGPDDTPRRSPADSRSRRRSLAAIPFRRRDRAY